MRKNWKLWFDLECLIWHRTSSIAYGVYVKVAFRSHANHCAIKQEGSCLLESGQGLYCFILNCMMILIMMVFKLYNIVVLKYDGFKLHMLFNYNDYNNSVKWLKNYTLGTGWCTIYGKTFEGKNFCGCKTITSLGGKAMRFTCCPIRATIHTNTYAVKLLQKAKKTAKTVKVFPLESFAIYGTSFMPYQ